MEGIELERKRRMWQENVEILLEGAIINRKRYEKRFKKWTQREEELRCLKEWFKD